jgi:ferredoxin-NADP reductase/ferredoxin
MLTIMLRNTQDASTTKLVLSRDELMAGVTVGRLSSCGICLNERSVSRKHGALRCYEDMLSYEDLGSTSGSKLNEKPLPENSKVPISVGDRLTLGPFQLIIDELDLVADETVDAPVVADDMEATMLAGRRPESYQPVAHVAPEQRRYWQGEMTVTCTNVIEETHDVKTFVFSPPADVLCHYEPGQFVTLQLNIDGAPVTRSYTISSSPSRPHTLTCTVKRVAATEPHPPGLVSNWLHDHMKPGEQIKVSGPFGQFSHVSHPAEKLCLISGGSGITPMLSMTRWICDTQADIDVVFLHAARAEQDLIARDELEYLSGRYPNLHLIFAVSQDGHQARWSGYRGRLSAAMLDLALPDLNSRRVFVCGPKGFMSSAKELLASRGFPMDRYHEESFGGAMAPAPSAASEPKAFGLKAALSRLAQPEATDAQADPTPQLAPQPASQPAQQPVPVEAGAATQDEVYFALSDKRIPAGGQSLLEAGEAAGLSLPFGCRAGMCGACKQVLRSGDIERADYDDKILSDADREAGYVLCCIARPKGAVVVEA